MALTSEGVVQRVHGGVALVRIGVTEPPRSERIDLQGSAKDEIAALMASLVEPDDSLLLDVGTTVEACARSLRPDYAGLVVTNSVPAVSALADRTGVEVHLLGGRVRLDELTTTGPDAEALLRQYDADKAILGCSGAHGEGGLTYYDVEMLGVRTAMVEAAQEVYVVADATKRRGTG